MLNYERRLIVYETINVSNEPNYELFKLIVNYEHFAISLTLIIKLIVLLVY